MEHPEWGLVYDLQVELSILDNSYDVLYYFEKQPVQRHCIIELVRNL